MPDPDLRYYTVVDDVCRHRLGIGVLEWVTDRLEDGQSWRSLPDLLAAATDQVVDVNRITLRRWWDAHRDEVAP